MGGAISIQTTSQAAGRSAIPPRVGDVSNQIRVATHTKVQAKAGPTAVHVGTANQETQLRAVKVGAANETHLQTVDQNMADVRTDHDMADVAVVEHPHPHEDWEQVEWEHPDKGYFAEDDGTALDPVQFRACVEREMAVHGRTRYMRVHQDQRLRGFC